MRHVYYGRHPLAELSVGLWDNDATRRLDAADARADVERFVTRAERGYPPAPETRSQRPAPPSWRPVDGVAMTDEDCDAAVQRLMAWRSPQASQAWLAYVRQHGDLPAWDPITCSYKPRRGPK